MTSTPSLTNSAICSVMAPMRVRDTCPVEFVRTDVPALMRTRRASRRAERDAGSVCDIVGVCVGAVCILFCLLFMFVDYVMLCYVLFCSVLLWSILFYCIVLVSGFLMRLLVVL